MVDIDRFKRVNDEFGHLTGDQVLMQVGRRLDDSVRHGIDIVARYGGEEFVVVLPETGDSGAMIVAERIRSACAEPIDPPEPPGVVSSGNGHGETKGPLHVTVSVGFACFPEDEGSATDLIRAADLAMYKAKARGGNAVIWSRQPSRPA